jgi:hypothetical protein
MKGYIHAAGLLCACLAAAAPAAAQAGLPPARAVLLELNMGGGFPGDKDMKDIYGSGLSLKESPVFAATQLGVGYNVTQRLQVAFLYGALLKEFEVAVSGGREKWELPVEELALRVRYLKPLSARTNLALGAGVGSYRMKEGKLTSSASVGRLDLTGSGAGGWAEAGLEWFWRTFALGVNAGWRFTELSPVKMEGYTGSGIVPKQDLVTATGRKPHFDYSGPFFGLALRWYLGGVR